MSSLTYKKLVTLLGADCWPPSFATSSLFDIENPLSLDSKLKEEEEEGKSYKSRL
jgi:hypothetical protein